MKVYDDPTRVTSTLTGRIETHAPIGARLLGIGPGSCHWATGGHIGTIGQTTRGVDSAVPVNGAPVVGLTPFPLLTNTVPANAHFLHVVHGLHRHYGLLGCWIMPCHVHPTPTNKQNLSNTTLNMIISEFHRFLLSCSILIVIHSIVLPTLNVKPTLFVIPCEFFTFYLWGGRRDRRFTVLRLPWLTKLTLFHPWQYFHHKLLTREGRVVGQQMNASIIHDSICKTHSLEVSSAKLPKWHQIPYDTKYLV